MEAWEQLSDRIYEALAGGGVEARRALTRIAEEVSEHEAELSREQQAYWRLLALAHLPGVTAEEAGEVRALASTLREDVELAWLASFYAAMALFYAGLVDACAEVVDGMAEPPDAGEQFAWRALKISELQLACEIWLRPSDARPEAIAEFFERSRQMSDPASMTLPEELLMALQHHVGAESGALRDGLCRLASAFAAEVRTLGFGGSFEEQVEAVVAALCGA